MLAAKQIIHRKEIKNLECSWIRIIDCFLDSHEVVNIHVI